MRAYLGILRVPGLGPLLGVSVLARLPIGVNTLALVLFLRAETGSFAVAGTVAGALALGTAAAAPVLGRLVDRLGVGVLVPVAAVHAGGLGALLVLGGGGAPAPLLVAVAALTGAAAPPVASTLRARYPRLLSERPELLPSAFALDSVLLEVVLVGGPLVVAVLVAVVAPAAALVLSAAAVLAGTVAFVALLPVAARPPVSGRIGHGVLGALRTPALRVLIAGTFPVGASFGALEVALPAFAVAEARGELAGVLVALLAVASIAGGLVFGAVRRGGDPGPAHRRVTALLPLAVLPAAAAPSMAAMALLVLPAGALRAPFVTTRNELAGAAAPRGAETEAFTWALTALVSGVGLGQAAAGVLAEAAGWQAAVLFAAGTAALGAAVAARLARRA